MDTTAQLDLLIQNAKLMMINCRVDHRTSMHYIGRKFDFYVVSYMKEGSSTLVINGETYEAHAGDVLIIPPNTPHDHVKKSNEKSCFMWWHFNYKICNTMDVLSLYDLPVLYHIEDDSHFQSVFSEYLSYKDNKNTLSDYILAEAKSIELVGVMLNTVISNTETKLYKTYNNPFMLMLGDIVENPVAYSSLDALSEKYHLHQTYISNQFKKLFKISPIRLAQQVSINRAQLMLTYNHSMPIYEIAHTLGYEEAGNFTRFFKTKTGMSPQDYRAFSITNFQTLPLPNAHRWESKTDRDTH